MRPDELDTAIRDELRTLARLAPPAGPVKAQVLLATRALPPDGLPPRGLRAWVVPMLAAAAVLLVTAGVTAGPRLLGSQGPDRTPPAVSGSTSAPASTSATPSASSTAASPSASASATPVGPAPAPHSSAAATRSSAASRAASGGGAPVPTVPQDWYRGLDVATLPHTPGLCPDPLTVGVEATLPAARPVSMPGEPAPLWLLPVSCLGLTDASHPAPVEVFRYAPDGPRLVQTLAYQPGDKRSIMVTSIRVEAGTLTFTEKGYSPSDALCCRSLRFSQIFSWQGADAHFIAGPQSDVLLPCAGDQLTVSGSALNGQSGDARGVLLRYANNGDEPCTLTGYPGAAIVDGTGRTLADAARTLGGPLGGLTSGDASRVVLYGFSSGSAVIEWTAAQHGSSQCHSEAELLSTPPGTTATASYGVQALVCDLQVHPVVRGDTGKQLPAG